MGMSYFQSVLWIDNKEYILFMTVQLFDARNTHRPTFKELYEELDKYIIDYRENNKNNNNEITIQIKKLKNFPKIKQLQLRK
ncbi:hypothetical protein Glove_97g118 [Diversispora epigaea]|uniref:Uncharacterized protein n=1 Tax=Diversispora epigaea TaxID=1348612 RepID=A0A397JE97_9GLOM|nr:hypothetical protein Glove_97g118 [Diversispora epigaea]